MGPWHLILFHVLTTIFVLGACHPQVPGPCVQPLSPPLLWHCRLTAFPTELWMPRSPALLPPWFSVCQWQFHPSQKQPSSEAQTSVSALTPLFISHCIANPPVNPAPLHLVTGLPAPTCPLTLLSAQLPDGAFPEMREHATLLLKTHLGSHLRQ